jgi:hypothetical protein
MHRGPQLPRVESFFPADDATDAALRRLAAA